MTQSIDETIITNFDECTTYDQVMALKKKLQAPHRRQITEIADVAKCRREVLREEELRPFHEEARRWRQGQKVYFGKPTNRSWLSFETMRMSKLYDITAGQWCKVWQYQPRKKLLWLCAPGKPCEYWNVIDAPFSLGDVQRDQISRVEPSIRK